MIIYHISSCSQPRCPQYLLVWVGGSSLLPLATLLTLAWHWLQVAW